jgi:hypothetical protein
VSLSRRVVEEAWGNVKECIEAAPLLAEVVGELRSLVLVLAEHRVAVWVGTRRLRGAIVLAEARGVTLNACWACVRQPCESLALWVPGVCGFALRCALRRGG